MNAFSTADGQILEAICQSKPTIKHFSLDFASLYPHEEWKIPLEDEFFIHHAAEKYGVQLRKFALQCCKTLVTLTILVSMMM